MREPREGAAHRTAATTRERGLPRERRSRRRGGIGGLVQTFDKILGSCTRSSPTINQQPRRNTMASLGKMDLHAALSPLFVAADGVVKLRETGGTAGVPPGWASKESSDMDAMKQRWQGTLVQFTEGKGFGYVPHEGTSVRFQHGEFEIRICQDGSSVGHWHKRSEAAIAAYWQGAMFPAAEAARRQPQPAVGGVPISFAPVKISGSESHMSKLTGAIDGGTAREQPVETWATLSGYSVDKWVPVDGLAGTPPAVTLAAGLKEPTGPVDGKRRSFQQAIVVNSRDVETSDRGCHSTV